MSSIVGRKSEIAILSEVKKSNQSELIAVFGRRRVGKTYLIREYYKNDIIFEVSGLYQGTLKSQIENFTKEINQRQKHTKNSKVKKWMDAFNLLENYLDKLKGKKKKVVFIDEFPWMATNKSNFLTAFESFWNQYATKRVDLIIIICGSAASYMIKNILKNKGGLHNRITRKIRLLPFNLQETKAFLKKKSIEYTQYDVLQLYMAIGGVPHYLDKLEKGLSVAQNIDKLCFDKDGILNDEFNILFASLFENAQKHELIVKILANSKKGITRDQLLKKSGIPSGGDFTLKLNELIESGFVSEYSYFQNKKKLTLYRLSDEYTLFYLKFIRENKNNGLGTWQQLSLTRSFSSWSGFSFETICLKHIQQIKKALKIDAIYSNHQSWFNENAQIDLLIDRADNVINLCEIKFNTSPFIIDKNYYLNLKNKVTELQKDINSRKNIFIVMITTHGIKKNNYSNEIVSNDLNMNILFE
ncbi:MAG: AAA family ATPase [Flavobacteriia bacterium]|nr:AAA family ATPase [Flavobacteriia bacterium]